nr:putative mediator of RNA polymerase II transcription subunit 24 [Ipomoea batatas]
MSSSSEGSKGRGMGFLFVFFPEDETAGATSPGGAPIIRKRAVNALLRRSNSTHLLSTAQSTISICALLIFITLLLFTLSTFEPTAASSHFHPRRQLSASSSRKVSSSFWRSGSPELWKNLAFQHALQGMGTLYRRGTRAMNDLVVAHAVESLTVHELKLFLRLLFRSGLSSKSDLLLIFPAKSAAFDRAVVEESESFLKLVHGAGDRNSTSFDSAQFKISVKKERESGEPVWGRKRKSNSSEELEGDDSESTRLSYGSVVSFDVDELDPENSLAGFLHHVPMSLRRWACYPMLLGRLRRNFKHLILVDAKELLLLGDPLSRLRSRSPESVHLSTLTPPAPPNHGRKTQPSHQKPVSPAIVMGGSRGVRRLSNAVLTEIVRAAMQHKKKNSVNESGLLNQLVGNEFVLKNINLIVSAESIPELSSLTGLNSRTGFSSSSTSNLSLVRRGSSNGDGSSSILKYLCSFSLDSAVYSDC